ncbi:hypothetical protein RJT34_10604 [Clitoria ternatea]|uniref:Uncharacterized protein n=1 Tax=Clitoria ternatea TaxID=43366 RepID=A0AAN9PJQ8_CLITE
MEHSRKMLCMTYHPSQLTIPVLEYLFFTVSTCQLSAYPQDLFPSPNPLSPSRLDLSLSFRVASRQDSKLSRAHRVDDHDATGVSHVVRTPPLVTVTQSHEFTPSRRPHL